MSGSDRHSADSRSGATLDDEWMALPREARRELPRLGDEERRDIYADAWRLLERNRD